MRRLFIIVSAVLLLVSLAGVFAARALPTEVEQETTLLSYEHEGRFDYLVYLKPSYLFGPEPQEPPPPPPPPPPNPKYPTAIIDRFAMSFTYIAATEASHAVRVKAVLENPGIWQKEISLVPYTSGQATFTVDFQLDIDKLNEIYDDIEEEIGIRSSERNVTIVAQAELGYAGELFIQGLPIKLGKNLIEVSSNLTQTSSGVTGKFNYLVYLKENSIYTETVLTPPIPPLTPPTPPSPAPAKTIGPGQVIFSKLVDRIDATFHYKFKSDKPIRELSQEVTITAVLENPEVWSKTFVLVPRTKKRGDFSIDFPLDISQFTEMLEAIRSETGVPAKSHNLTIKADVHTIAQTDFGEIDEVFTQTLSTALGKGTLEWNEELVESKLGSIETTKMTPNPEKYLGLSVNGARNLSTALAGGFFLLFLFSVVLNIKLKPEKLSRIEEEALRARKKYGELISEVSDLLPIREGEVIIRASSLEALANISNNSLKPILLKVEPDKHTYYVIDGLVRYEYINKLELPAKEERTEDERFQT